MPVRKLLNTYYKLTKPGIIYGNAVTALAGFFLASNGNVDYVLLGTTLMGISLVIASACVFNNFLDRDIDSKMERTKNRAIPIGSISGQSAIIYATTLGIIGISILASFTNNLVIALGLIGFFFYVVLYGIFKRRSVHGTIVGSVSGAIPVVVGYSAVGGSFDAVASMLFLILVFWQMPHFYAIAMFRIKDYAAASIPVLPINSGVRITKVYILAYIAAFIIAMVALWVIGAVGYVYLIAVLTAGLVWLWQGLKGFKAPNNGTWAKKMFRYSLIVLLVFCLMISTDVFLP